MTTQPNTPSAVARQMYNLARMQTRSYVRRSLFGGLQIALERNGERWRLAIARTDKMPSQTEAKAIARDFSVPDGTTWEAAHKTSKKKVTYKVLECTWTEGVNV